MVDEAILAGSALEEVTVFSTGDAVVALVAFDHITAEVAIEPIIAAFAADGVGEKIACDPITLVAACDPDGGIDGAAGIDDGAIGKAVAIPGTIAIGEGEDDAIDFAVAIFIQELIKFLSVGVNIFLEALRLVVKTHVRVSLLVEVVGNEEFGLNGGTGRDSFHEELKRLKQGGDALGNGNVSLPPDGSETFTWLLMMGRSVTALRVKFEPTARAAKSPWLVPSPTRLMPATLDWLASGMPSLLASITSPL